MWHLPRIAVWAHGRPHKFPHFFRINSPESLMILGLYRHIYHITIMNYHRTLLSLFIWAFSVQVLCLKRIPRRTRCISTTRRGAEEANGESLEILGINDGPQSINARQRSSLLQGFSLGIAGVTAVSSLTSFPIPTLALAPKDTGIAAVGYKAVQSAFAPGIPLYSLPPLLPQSALLNSLPIKVELIGQLQAYIESFVQLANPLPNIQRQVARNSSTLWSNLRINAQRAAGMFLYNEKELLPFTNEEDNDDDSEETIERRAKYGKIYLDQLQENVLLLVRAAYQSDVGLCLKYMRKSLTGLCNVAYLLVPEAEKTRLLQSQGGPLEKSALVTPSTQLLRGRATVVLTFSRPGPAQILKRKSESANSMMPPNDKAATPTKNGKDKSGKNSKSGKSGTEIDASDMAKVTVIVDGLNHPVAGGNFIDLCQKRFYNGLPVKKDTFEYLEDSVERVIFGSAKEDYVDPFTNQPRRLPLEIFREGAEEGRITTTGSARNSAVFTRAKPVMSFATSGALGMMHEIGDPNGANSAFFWVKPDRSKTLAERHTQDALARLNARYTLFAYCIDGIDVLEQLKAGDVLVSTEVEGGLWELTPAGKTLMNQGDVWVQSQS